MEFSLSTQSIEKLKANTLLVGVFADHLLTEMAHQIDEANEGVLADIIKHKEFTAKVGETLSLRNLKNVKAREVLFVGLGESSDYDEDAFIKAFTQAIKSVRGETIAVDVAGWGCQERSFSWTLMHMAICATTLQEPLREADINEKDKRKVVFILNEKGEDFAEALHLGETIGHAMNEAKWLGNLPPNTCTPAFLAEIAKSYKSLKNVTVKVHNRKAIEKIGMTSFLSVSQGSAVEPHFIEVHYMGGQKDEAPVCLVGKGITLDAGGLCLKPGSSMLEMKYDMCGAAAVLASVHAAALMKLPINVIALVPACENLPDANAIKPSDVIKTLSGLTVEVLNTDAEGRLILADALTYAKRYEPQSIVDVATLTGACVVSLGDVYNGLFVNDPILCDSLELAADVSMDVVWALPFNGKYKSMIKSNVADIANIGPRGKAGAPIAATFLAKFIDDEMPWAHLDVAGTANTGGTMGKSTARPVPLLVTWLHQLAHTRTE